MEKTKVMMRNWEPYVYDGEYNLSGTADVHPRLGRNVYVATTSTLIKASLEEDALIYETRNTIYCCQLKYMRVSPYGNVVQEYREELSHLDTFENALDRIIAAAAKISLGEPEDTTDEMVRKIRTLQKTGQQEIAQMEEQEKQHLLEIAGKYEDCVYIEVSSVHSGSKLAYHLGDAVGIVEPIVHSGMFQDSVLYMKYATEEDHYALDFRYFPKGFGDVMETYSWSDNIKQAVIKNQKGHSLIFNHEEIAPGETKVFTPDTHKQGLFSPDCYNGKSLFTVGEEDEENESCADTTENK